MHDKPLDCTLKMDGLEQFAEVRQQSTHLILQHYPPRLRVHLCRLTLLDTELGNRNPFLHYAGCSTAGKPGNHVYLAAH